MRVLIVYYYKWMGYSSARGKDMEIHGHNEIQ